MYPYISFETAIEFLVIAYLTSGVVLMAAAKICLAAIETLEETYE